MSKRRRDLDTVRFLRVLISWEVRHLHGVNDGDLVTPAKTTDAICHSWSGRNKDIVRFAAASLTRVLPVRKPAPSTTAPQSPGKPGPSAGSKI